MIRIYDPATNTWTKNGTMPLGTGDENAWATLQNGGILAVGYHNGGAAIYNPASNTWKKTTVPSGFDTGDTGGITQMFDGRVYVYGLNFHSYIWTPGATADDIGTWVEGPKLLDTEAEDESPTSCQRPGDGRAGAHDVRARHGAAAVRPDDQHELDGDAAARQRQPLPIDYVNLPTGQVMVTAGNAVWILTLTDGPQDAWRPTVSSVAYNASANTYTLSGTQISGLVNGADEGDDMTMAQNYPIVWLTDSSGNVSYCRSFIFSSMFPSKGSKVETTDFTTPAGLPNGSYNPYVSAVGVQSKNPFPFTVGQSSTTGAAGSSGSGTGGSSAGTGGAAGSAAPPGTGGATGGGGVKRNGRHRHHRKRRHGRTRWRLGRPRPPPAGLLVDHDPRRRRRVDRRLQWHRRIQHHRLGWRERLRRVHRQRQRWHEWLRRIQRHRKRRLDTARRPGGSSGCSCRQSPGASRRGSAFSLCSGRDADASTPASAVARAPRFEQSLKD